MFDTIYARGENGKEYNVSDFAGDVYFYNGIKYNLKEKSKDTFIVSDNPEGVRVVYEKSNFKLFGSNYMHFEL